MPVSMATKPSAAAAAIGLHSPMVSSYHHISMPWLTTTTWPPGTRRRPISAGRQTWRHRGSVTWHSPTTMTYRLARTWLVETRGHMVSTARPSCLTSRRSLPAVTTSAKTHTSNLSRLYSSSKLCRKIATFRSAFFNPRRHLHNLIYILSQ